MFEIGDEGMNEIIDPPMSAAGFHRGNREEVQISGEEKQKTGTEGDLTPDNSKEESFKKDSLTGCTRYFKLDYYKQYFDVCELDVITRVRASITIPPNDDFMNTIRSKPDFYGPFWLMTTIIALLGVVGNFSNYLLSKFSDDAVWSAYFFDLSLFRYAFVFVYSYGFGISTGIYFLCKIFSNNLKLNLPDIICLYGYSFSPFVLAIVGCILPLGFFQWILILAAFGISSNFLYQSIKNHCERVSPFVLLGLIAGIQIVFSLTVKLVFIHLLS